MKLEPIDDLINDLGFLIFKYTELVGEDKCSHVDTCEMQYRLGHKHAYTDILNLVKRLKYSMEKQNAEH